MGAVKIGHDVDPKATKASIVLNDVPAQPFNLYVKITKADAKETQYLAIGSLHLLVK